MIVVIYSGDKIISEIQELIKNRENCEITSNELLPILRNNRIRLEA